MSASFENLNQYRGAAIAPVFYGTGVPINGTAGNYAGIAPPGALYIDSGTSFTYQNTGTLASPTWTLIISGTGGSPLNIGLNSAITGGGLTANSSGISISIPGSTISSYENFPALVNTSALAFNGASVSAAVAFELPDVGSFSFLRIPVLMTTNSTTVASAAGLSTGGGFVYRTWNAVMYAPLTGANSASWSAYASGSHGETISNSFSFNTANSAWSVSQGYTFNVAGNQTSVSSQYSATSASLNVSTNYLTNNSSLRWLDINFANSLAGGNYVLIVGFTSSSTTSGQSGVNLTNAGVSYSNHYAITQINSWFNQLGDTAGSSGLALGAGSFSTAGGGTTASFANSNISSAANNPQVYFQLLRSA